MNIKDNLSSPFWALQPEEALRLTESSDKGLESDEVLRRLKEFGKNILPKSEKATKLHIVLSQFQSPLILVLVLAWVVTLFISDYKDSIFILAAVLANVALGFYQENKAETALSSLNSYLRERVRIIRDDKEIEIDAEEIVPGDIVRLIQGVRIPADGRVTYVNNLRVDESILTGESLSVHKKIEAVKVGAGIADRSSMVFGGTLVEEGIGLSVTTATGTSTEIGKIAALVKSEREQTPLQVALNKFATNALVILGALTFLLFVLGIYSGYGFLEMFLISIAVAVAAIPEGLPIVLTVVLAVGVERLARKKGVIRKLLAAETLGSTTVILTDKTGTLTEGKMKLDKIITVDGVLKEELLELAVLNADVIVENPDDGADGWRLVGKALEVSLVKAAAEHKVLLREVGSKFKILDRHPFNSTDKFSAVYVEGKRSEFWSYLGAPEKLLEKVKISEKEREHIILTVDDLAYAGYRILGVARDDTFLGLLAFRDPIRESAKLAVLEAKSAGVRTIIVTGDHKGTAEAVAKELGMEISPHEVMTGGELINMKDEELKNKLGEIKIFARVTPEDKLRLVSLFQTIGEVVAVTGDGVNDAPALKAADIGVAVGSGTDVAKGAADLVILDNNFETIVVAIEEGRRMISNIKKAIVYLLSGSLNELLLIGGSFIVGLSLPLNALQILFVNFFADSFPAVAFAFENGENHLREKPPKLKDRLFDSRMKFLIVGVGTLSSLLLFIMYYTLINLNHPADLVRSFIFASFALYTLFVAFSLRSLKTSIFKYNPFSNGYLVLGVIVGLFFTLASIYLPVFQGAFGTVSLPWPWLVGVIGFGLFNVTIVEIIKSIFRRNSVL